MFTAIFNLLNTEILAILMLQTDFENCQFSYSTFRNINETFLAANDINQTCAIFLADLYQLNVSFTIRPLK